MFDIKWIRANPERFDAGLARRGLPAQAQALLALDDERRAHVAKLQDAQSRRNAASKEIGKAKASGDDATAESLIAEVADLKASIQTGEDEERRLDAALRDALSGIPNLPLEDVPVGEDEAANVERHRHGTPSDANFRPAHYDIGEALGMMDFDAASAMSGARFVVLKNGLARLERAIANFMLDTHTGEFGYQEMAPPLLVRDPAMFGTGQLPKFAEDLFRTTDDFWLVPTAEVPLTNLVREQILNADDLPLRFTAWTPCFRSEAGAAGRDTRGMIRMHQFSKVELVSITTPDRSLDELERMLGCAEHILKALGLAYRVVTLSTGDMGFSAQKTYDIEVWLPAQNTYREISSCSVCGDFQARRMNARFRTADGDVEHVHTLNGSGLAVGRTLIAVLENYVEGDGSVTVPDVLRPYMGGMERIAAQ